MSPKEKESLAGGMTHRSRPRVWVLVAGGLMALGWILVILALLTGQPDAAVVFVLAIMLPVAIWWRYKERRQSILRAFVTPMQAAVAEWRASR